MAKRHKQSTGHAHQHVHHSAQHSSTIHVAIDPKKLIAQKKFPEAIRELSSQLKRTPTDDHYKHLLGECYFQTQCYMEAVAIWREIDHKQAFHVSNIGVALLCAEEWEEAITLFSESPEVQEDPYTAYFLAHAYLRGNNCMQAEREVVQRVIALLDNARSLPECPPEVYLLLDDALSSYPAQQGTKGDDAGDRGAYNRNQHFHVLEEAFTRFPDNDQIRIEFAKALIYWREQYESGLLVLSPLLQNNDTDAPATQIIGLCIDACMRAEWYEKALHYLDQLSPSPQDEWLPGQDVFQLRGDICLLQRDFPAARACFEQVIARGTFAGKFFGLFSCARTWLLEERPEEALLLVRQALALWFDGQSWEASYGMLDREPQWVGTIRVEEEGPTRHLKAVCEMLLENDHLLDSQLRGQIAFLLYRYYEDYCYVAKTEEARQERAAHEPLLLQAASCIDHPLLHFELRHYFCEQGDYPQAVSRHLLFCLQELAAAEEDFDEDLGEYDFFDTIELTPESCRKIHQVAWGQLQAHQTSLAVQMIFLPFYRSFWGKMLQREKMHQEIVAVLAIFLRLVPANEVGNERWTYAYTLAHIGNNQEAESVYRSCLESDPDNTATLNNLSLLLEKKGHLQDALALLRRGQELDPQDSVIAGNHDRVTRKLAQSQRAQAGEGWSQLSDGQKVLLYLLDEFKPTEMTSLSSHARIEASQLAADWASLLKSGAIRQTADGAATIEPTLLPFVRREGFLLLVIADIIKNTSPRKKQPWIPTLDAFVNEASVQLDKSQRASFHKAAFKRLQTCEDSIVLDTVYRPFYHATWKRLLVEGNMNQEIVDVAHVLTTRLQGQSREELWDYAYYAYACALLKEAEQGYKRYLEGDPTAAAYHNLALIAERLNRFDEAIAYADAALNLIPGKEDTAKLKERFLQKKEQQQQEMQRQQELAAKEQRQQENLLRTAPERWGKVDQYKRRILGTLAAMTSFAGMHELAQLVDMEERVLRGHWRGLLEKGMVIEQEDGPRVNPYILDLVKRERTHAVVTRIVHTSADVLSKPIFNSQKEYTIYQRLLEIFPNQLVFPNMSLQTIFSYDRMQTVLSKEEFRYYLMASVDFCITRTSDYLPLVTFEVDSDYHDSEEQMSKDHVKDRIFALGGVGLIRLRAFGQPSPEAMRYDIIEAVKEWMKSAQRTPSRSGWAIDLAQEIDLERYAAATAEKEVPPSQRTGQVAQ